MPSNWQHLVEEADLGGAVTRSDIDGLREGGVGVTKHVGQLPIGGLAASRLLPDCRSDIKVDVPPREIAVGPSGLGGPTNFLLAFDLSGKNKNTYGLIAGATNPELGGVQPATEILTCPADGRTVNSVGYLFRGSEILDTKSRGKLGDRVLIGHATKGGDRLYWVLTTRRDCGRICGFLPFFDIEPVVVPVSPSEPPFSDAPDPGVPDPDGPPTCGGVPC